ncbi:hypothetical protein MYAM1_001308 [Malassezia yamatoensis]|uniref:Inner nuclear membrane protein SRC1 n=1 Tax=Malassezia yamatoensis TaxID=253288 RepID=A0AAJ6CHB4_9BASI|nr:hypothetical protein MYAM1_001308 [Malassezia yamatoensis]
MLVDSLDAGVDASTLRVADLRRILYEHEIAVPTGMRKAQLIESFNAYVRPNLPHAQDKTPIAASASKKSPILATPRKQKQTSTEDSAKLKKDTAPDWEHISTPEIKFADANPFQTASHTKRKPTPTTPSDHQQLGAASTSKKQGASSLANKCEEQEVCNDPSTSDNDRQSHEGLHRKNLVAAEEPALKLHTPTRSSKEVRAIASGARSRREPTPSSSVENPVANEVRLRHPTMAIQWKSTVLRWMLWTSIIAWLYYCHRTRVLGFCLPSENPTDLSWQASCTPCPEHGICSDRKLVSCDNEYVSESPNVAQIPVLRSAVPYAMTAPRCVPDTYKLILGAEMADGILDYLAHWHGQVQCSRASPYPDAPKQDLGRYAVPSEQLYAELMDRVDDSIDESMFDSVWSMAISGLEQHESSEFAQMSNHGKTWFVSKRASMPLLCRIRLHLQNLLWRSRVRVTTITVILTILWLLLMRFRRARTTKKQDARLVQAVYQKLQEQARAHAISKAPRELPTVQLRDELLEDESNARTRLVRWTRVSRIVEQNTNVRTRQIQWHGEWQRVWEWIGRLYTVPPSPTDTRTNIEAAQSNTSSPSERQATATSSHTSIAE